MYSLFLLLPFIPLPLCLSRYCLIYSTHLHCSRLLHSCLQTYCIKTNTFFLLVNRLFILSGGVGDTEDECVCVERTRVCLLKEVCVCLHHVVLIRGMADVIKLQLLKVVPKSIVLVQKLAHWVYALSIDTSTKASSG